MMLYVVDIVMLGLRGSVVWRGDGKEVGTSFIKAHLKTKPGALGEQDE